VKVEGVEGIEWRCGYHKKNFQPWKGKTMPKREGDPLVTDEKTDTDTISLLVAIEDQLRGLREDVRQIAPKLVEGLRSLMDDRKVAEARSTAAMIAELASGPLAPLLERAGMGGIAEVLARGFAAGVAADPPRMPRSRDCDVHEYLLPDGKCSCPKEEDANLPCFNCMHSSSDHARVEGGGPCGVEGCECQAFTWIEVVGGAPTPPRVVKEHADPDLLCLNCEHPSSDHERNDEDGPCKLQGCDCETYVWNGVA
jgi:hypothetical protein